MLREELQLLQEPGSYVGEVIKVLLRGLLLTFPFVLPIILLEKTRLQHNFVSVVFQEHIAASLRISCHQALSGDWGSVPHLPYAVDGKE